MVGALGTVYGTTPLDSSESGPAPTAFTAFTRKVYVTPGVRSLTVTGLATAATGVPGVAPT
jgi:hypothetical protein